MSPVPVPLPTRVFLACGVTDMRKGFDGLAVLVQQVLAQNPHSGALFAFRGKRGHLVKLLWFDGQGLCLFSKRLDRGRFVWPVTATGTITLTPAQLSMLLEGIDWRLSCPLLSGPSTMTVWTKEGTTNAFEEAQARGDHRQAA